MKRQAEEPADSSSRQRARLDPEEEFNSATDSKAAEEGDHDLERHAQQPPSLPAANDNDEVVEEEEKEDKPNPKVKPEDEKEDVMDEKEGITDATDEEELQDAIVSAPSPSRQLPVDSKMDDKKEEFKKDGSPPQSPPGSGEEEGGDEEKAQEEESKQKLLHKVSNQSSNKNKKEDDENDEGGSDNDEDEEEDNKGEEEEDKDEDSSKNPPASSDSRGSDPPSKDGTMSEEDTPKAKPQQPASPKVTAAAAPKDDGEEEEEKEEKESARTSPKKEQASPKKEEDAATAAAPKEDDEVDDTSADAEQGLPPSAAGIPAAIASDSMVADLVDDDKEEEEEEPSANDSKGKADNKKDDDNTQINDDEHLSNSSYPSPKNFAERMMNALESGMAAESVWWVGNGKAVALCPKKLRNSPHLTSYFRAKDYSGFIRNCNRWGFRRVACYTVKPGIVTYENALFQKAHPHLVKHMRMDSDVQDVFARHQQDGSETTQAEGKLRQSKMRGGARRYRKRLDPDEDFDSADSKKDGDGGSAAGEGGSAGGATGLAVSGADFLSNIPIAPGGDAAIGKEMLLRKILALTESFLNHPGKLTTDEDSFRTTLQLLQALGQQHQKVLVTNGNMTKIRELEADAARGIASPEATAAVPESSPPPAMASASMGQQTGMLFNPSGLGAAQSMGAHQGFLGLSGAVSATSRFDPIQALLLQAQSRNPMIFPQQRNPSQQDAEASMLNQMLSNRYLMGNPIPGMAAGFGASMGGAPAPGAGAAAGGGTPIRGPMNSQLPSHQHGGYHDGEDGDERIGEEAATEEAARRLAEQMQQPAHADHHRAGAPEERPSYTSAQELMMRVMRQQQQQEPRGPGGGRPRK